MKNKNIVGAYEGRKIDNERFLTALRTLCYIARFDEFNLKNGADLLTTAPRVAEWERRIKFSGSFCPLSPSYR